MEIQKGEPPHNGMYVCYLPMVMGYERKLLMWFGGRWSYPSSDQFYRDEVFGWIGPLPILKIEAKE